MLERLEKRFGKYAIKNLIYYILGAYVIGYILALASPSWYYYITLDPGLVMRGQVWRLFTWVCTIPQSLNIFIIFMFLFYYFIGKTLEQHMGAFKYNVYILSGWLFTTLGTMLVYWIFGVTITPSTYYLNLASFLTFALLFPDTRVYLFGILPIRMKILAIIDAVYLGLQVFSGLVVAVAPASVVRDALQVYYGYPPSDLEFYAIRSASMTLMITILLSMLNFLIFFFATAKNRAEAKKRRTEYQRRAQQGYQRANANASGSSDPFSWRRQQSQNDAEPKKTYRAAAGAALVHKCEICGRTSTDYPELMFRYCSKCSGEHEYCQDHIFTHEHIH